MNIKKALVFGLVTVSLLGVIAVYAKNEEQSKGKKTVSLEEYNRKTEVNVTTMYLHERVEKEGIGLLDSLSGVELPGDVIAKTKILNFIQKNKPLRALHSNVSSDYNSAIEKSKSTDNKEKQQAVRLYDKVVETLNRGKGNIKNNVYVYMDIAEINKDKSRIYKDLKDVKNQKDALKTAILVYDQAIKEYKKDTKQYDDGTDPDLHIGKSLQYDKSKVLEELADMASSKTEKKKLLLQALESYSQLLKYNSKGSCDEGCVIVDSRNIKEIYNKIKNL